MEDAGIYFQNSIASQRNRLVSLSFFYSVRVHPAFKNLGRDGNNDDETDGTYSNGDRRGNVLSADTSGIKLKF